MRDIKIYAFAGEASPVIDEQIATMLRNELNGLEMRNVEAVFASTSGNYSGTKK